jgi:hypothetical protein
VADLAEDASSTLLGIVQPVIRGKEACIHAIVERQWFVHFLQETSSVEPPKAQSGD